MYKAASKSERIILKAMTDLLMTQPEKYETLQLSGNCFLIKDLTSGEVFEIQITGDIDPDTFE